MDSTLMTAAEVADYRAGLRRREQERQEAQEAARRKLARRHRKAVERLERHRAELAPALDELDVLERLEKAVDLVTAAHHAYVDTLHLAQELGEKELPEPVHPMSGAVEEMQRDTSLALASLRMFGAGRAARRKPPPNPAAIIEERKEQLGI